MKCPGCGGLLHRDTRRRGVEYKCFNAIFDQPGWYCNTVGCKDGILDPNDIKYWDREMKKLIEESKKYPRELIEVAEEVGGELGIEDGQFYLQIDTEDEDPKENGKDAIDTAMYMDRKLKDYKTAETWADHDTQIIDFVLREDKK